MENKEVPIIVLPQISDEKWEELSQIHEQDVDNLIDL